MPSKIDILTKRIEESKQAEEMLKQIKPKDNKTKRSLEKIKRQRRIMEKEKNIREEYKESIRRTPVENDEKENRTAYLKRIKSARKKLREELRSKYRHLNPNKMSEEDSRRLNRMNEIIRDVRKRKRVLKTYKKLKRQYPKLYGRGETANPCLQKCPKETLRELQLRKMRKELVEGMRMANNDLCFMYIDTNNPYYRLPPSHWQPVKPLPSNPNSGQSINRKFKLKPGVKPSDAVNIIFSNRDCNIVTECVNTINMIYLRAILKTVGKDSFNKMFKNGITLQDKMPELRKYQKNKPLDISQKSDLKKGDWVYFYNYPDYSDKHPKGYWQGENAIVLGSDQYEGFGVPKTSEEEMNKDLLEAYNTGLPRKERKSMGVDSPPGLKKPFRPKKSEASNKDPGKIHRFVPDVSNFPE